MSKNTPKILNDIVDILKTANLTAAESIGGEGRAGSLKDEQNVIDFLKSHPIIGPLIVAMPEKKSKKKSEARKVGDLLIKDPSSDMIHVINIKTTNGSTDNATSKLGFLIAFTDIPLEDLPNTINWKKWTELIKSRKSDIPGRDYWYLVLEKSNMNHIIIRGAKQVNNWIPNPSNDLQINWSKEWELAPAEHSFDESYNKVINGLRLSKSKITLLLTPLLFDDNLDLKEKVEKHLKKHCSYNNEILESLIEYE